MYHHIRDPKLQKRGLPRNLSTDPAAFLSQLDWLSSHGYHTVTFANLAAAGLPLPEHPVVLSFDDGYDNAYSVAFPALHERKMVGTFYIISGDVGKAGYVTWEQLQEMKADGMEIAPHTATHPNLSRLSKAEQTEEITESIAALGEHLHVRVFSFAYPAGRYNATTLSILQNIGVPYAVTTHYGNATDRSKPLELPRMRMSGKEKMESVVH